MNQPLLQRWLSDFVHLLSDVRGRTVCLGLLQHAGLSYIFGASNPSIHINSPHFSGDFPSQTSLPKPHPIARSRRKLHRCSPDRSARRCPGRNKRRVFPPWIERRDRREIYGRSIEYDEFLFFNHWPLQEPKFDWRYRFHLFLAKKFQAYFWGNIPAKYGLIWYSTSILGSWNSHWLRFLGLAGWSRAMIWTSITVKYGDHPPIRVYY